MNTERLLNVAKALRESPNPEKFTMYTYGYGCRTPACALGHYAARADLQLAFELNGYGSLVSDGRFVHCDAPAVLDHFGIRQDQADELFSARGGCGGAKTAVEAAEYVEKFVADHELAARGIEP